MATSLKISEKGGRIVHLQFNTYYVVQRLWKSVQRILRYFGFEQTSAVRHKIVVPWNIEKRISDLSSTPKTLPYGIKNAKIARGLWFAYDTKLVAKLQSYITVMWATFAKLKLLLLFVRHIYIWCDGNTGQCVYYCHWKGQPWKHRHSSWNFVLCALETK